MTSTGSIQIDAPGTVASFLQRLGRTGRRAGSRATCSSSRQRMRPCSSRARLHRWQRVGEVEPVVPPPLPYHLFAQQLLALSLQERRLGLHAAVAELLAVPPFDTLDRDNAAAVARFLVTQDWLTGDDGLVSTGPESERTLGYRHFAELTSSFTADPEITVRYGQLDVGRVHPLTFPRRDERTWRILLGGRTWLVQSIDWRRRIAHAVPDKGAGKSRWRGDARALPAAICRQTRAVLCGSEPQARLSQRAGRQLAQLRREFAWIDPDATTIVRTDDEIRWWTFAGLRANAQIADALGPLAAGAQSLDNLSLVLASGQPLDGIAARLKRLQHDPLGFSDSRAGELASNLKFADCLPTEIAREVVGRRSADSDSVARAVYEPRRVVTLVR